MKNLEPELNSIALVSVIIPCFRCAETIDRAVDSIARQTQKPAEVILIDDGSGDGTLAALQNLEKQYPHWIKVIVLQENQGAANARNAGWTAATQPYIAFLDADDSWHPEKLRLQYGYMRSHPEVAISGHRYVCLRGNNVPIDHIGSNNVTKIGKLALIFKNRFSTPTVMLKCVIPFRFVENKRYSDDYDLWLQIVYSGYDAMFLDAPLTYLYKAPYGEGGLSARLWAMEKGTLDCFGHLYRTQKINFFMLVLSSLFSIAKYIRRCIFVFLSRLGNSLR